MTQEQGQAILQASAQQLAATQATGVLLTQVSYWVQVACWLLLASVFLAAMRRFGK